MYQDKISAYFDNPTVREELVSAITKLASIRSVTGEEEPGKPFGAGPAAALEAALDLCSSMGFSTRNYDGYVGLTDFNDKETALHILGHLDVVGEGTGWTACEPYAPKVIDGLLYGRGVSDDKGPVMAALFAMKAVKDLGIPLKSNVRLVMGTDEESGSSDIAYYYAREPYAPYTFTPDSDFPLINIEKGHYHPDFGAEWAASTAPARVTALKGGFRTNVVPPEAEAAVCGLERSILEPFCGKVAQRTGVQFTLSSTIDGITIHSAGKNAHASTPQAGNNALTALLELLAALPLSDCGSTKAIHAMNCLFPHGDVLGKALGIAQSDPESGELTLNLALMTLSETGFTAKIDVRYPLCANEGSCKQAAEATFAKHGIQVTGDPDMTPTHHVPADSTLVRTLLNCYSQYTGVANPKPIATGGGTYVHDIPGGVAFGMTMPGFDCKMHGADERIRLDDLYTSCKIFTQAIVDLCG